MKMHFTRKKFFCLLFALIMLKIFLTSFLPAYENYEIRKYSLKYILLWTNPKNVPFVYLGVGQEGFISRKCKYTNCFVTSDRRYLYNVKNFDVIAFLSSEVKDIVLPQERSPHQKYVFASIESPGYYSICPKFFDGFFNWTWTYKLDSDSRWGYIVVRDANNSIVGPNTNMAWIKLEDMAAVSEDLKDTFRNKSKAAAWFVSNCVTASGREEFAHELDNELKLYNLTIDVYGECSDRTCTRGNQAKCDNLIKRDYYFYLAFENSFGEDYVTEKILHGLNNNAIPIVYGTANYTRFMPDGIYLNAAKLGARKLAAKMAELISDIEKYSEYFKWKNHYRFHTRGDTIETNEYCAICALLNDENKLKETTIYTNFRSWWNNPGGCYYDET